MSLSKQREVDASIAAMLQESRMLGEVVVLSMLEDKDAATLHEHYDEVLNFFVNRATNAYAESFNAKVKAFRAVSRGVSDIKFFLFRLTKLYA